jgi:hypothetical protein
VSVRTSAGSSSASKRTSSVPPKKRSNTNPSRTFFSFFFGYTCSHPCVSRCRCDVAFSTSSTTPSLYLSKIIGQFSAIVKGF